MAQKEEIMRIKTIILAPLGFLLAITLLTLAVALAQPAAASAADNKKDTTKTQTKVDKKSDGKADKKAADAKKNDKVAPAKTYNYVAQSGDSYSLMARKAVQTYGLTSKVKLSGAQIIFSETNLTEAAGSPVLNLGQKVTIKQSAVQSWVTKAQKISSAEAAAWNYYVPFVDFNTNKVGEAS